MSLNITLSQAFVAGAACISLALFLRQMTRPRCPPGPRPLPLLGNLLDMPSTYQHLTFAKWAERWGDIISFSVFGQRYIVVSTLQCATELLEKRGAIYSDRPYLPMAGRLMGWDQMVTLSSYGDRFRSIRRLLHQTLGSRGQADRVVKYYDMEEFMTRRFLTRLLRSPENLVTHIRTLIGAGILKLSYGYDAKEEGDVWVELVDRAAGGFIAATTAGSYLVDMIHALEYLPSWMPGSGWRKQGALWRQDFDDMANIPYKTAKDEVLAGKGSENFVSLNLDFAKDETSEEYLKMAAMSIYAGGADTTVSSIYSFFLAMVLYPDVQKRAQQELDSVVGSDRLPSFTDREHLPYINALCLEVFRWIPIGPLAIPHRSTQDDWYNGYFIPKGSIVFPNIWKMLHDPEIYPEPMEFRPERFLSTEHSAPEQDPRIAVFGFGRRVCPGMNLAEISIFIAVAMTLAVYKIGKAVENGVEITPSAEHTSGTISHPKPFKCSIEPRSDKAKALIMASAAA